MTRPLFFLLLLTCALCIRKNPYTQSQQCTSLADAYNLRTWDHMVSVITFGGGFVHPALGMRSDESSGDVTLFAKDDVGERNVVLLIPDSVALTPQTMYNEFPSFKQLSTSIGDEEKVWLAYLAYMRYSTNEHIGLHMAPEFCVNGIYFSEEMEGMLTDHEYERVNGSLKRLINGWNSFQSALQKENIPSSKGFDKLTFDDYKWAACVHRSRNFERATSFAMLPLGDLFSHATDPNLKWKLDKQTFMWTFTTKTNISKGVEFTIDYGTRNILELLVQYGFLVAGNPESSHYISISSFEDAKKQKIADDLLGGESTVRITRTGITQKGLAILAINHLTDKEIEEGMLDSLALQQVSEFHSQKVWEWLINYASDKIANMPGDDETDKVKSEELREELKATHLTVKERISKSVKWWIYIYRIEIRDFFRTIRNYCQNKINKIE